MHDQVRALRDIKAGEELRQSYIDETLSLPKRQRELKRVGQASLRGDSGTVES